MNLQKVSTISNMREVREDVELLIEKGNELIGQTLSSTDMKELKDAYKPVVIHEDSSNISDLLDNSEANLYSLEYFTHKIHGKVEQKCYVLYENSEKEVQLAQTMHKILLKMDTLSSFIDTNATELECDNQNITSHMDSELSNLSRVCYNIKESISDMTHMIDEKLLKKPEEKITTPDLGESLKKLSAAITDYKETHMK